LVGWRHFGAAAALPDFQYILVALSFTLPLLVCRQSPDFGVKDIAGALVLGSVVYSCIALGLLAAPQSVRAVVYASPTDTYAASMRVGFGNGTVLMLTIPLALVLAGVQGLRQRRRVLLTLALAIMCAGALVSQSRTLLVLLALNIAVTGVVLWRTGRAGHVRRSFPAALAALAVVFAGWLVAGLVQFDAAANVPQQALGRIAVLTQFDSDPNYMTRSRTWDATIDTWTHDGQSLLLGRGLGAQLPLVSPYGGLVTWVNRVDNVWAVLALKGGLAALAIFAALLVCLQVVFVRAARHSARRHEGTLWSVAASCFPGLALTTLVTNHLLYVPGLTVVLVTMGMLAAMASASGRSGE